MAYHNEDIAACTNNRCKQRFNCKRWYLAQNKDPHQTYLLERAVDGCEFQITLN